MVEYSPMRYINACDVIILDAATISSYSKMIHYCSCSCNLFLVTGTQMDFSFHLIGTVFFSREGYDHSTQKIRTKQHGHGTPRYSSSKGLFPVH